MSNNDIYEKIDSWYDGELDRKDEANLFALLSVDENARDYFQQLSKLKNGLGQIEEDFPDALDERILRSTQPADRSIPVTYKSSFQPYLGYAFSIVFALVALFFYMEIRSYRTNLENISVKVKEQDQTIKMMFNAYPTIVVKPGLNNPSEQ